MNKYDAWEPKDIIEDEYTETSEDLTEDTPETVEDYRLAKVMDYYERFIYGD
jgi:hypothetical protein